MSEIYGRHYRTGIDCHLVLRDGVIREVVTDSAPLGPDDEDDPATWIAPAFWDIQTNGRWGISFSDPSLTADQVAEIVLEQARLGTARLCPTLITASREATEHGLRTIAAACDRDPEVGAMVAGIHLEGPYISPLDGYRGAHPASCVRQPDWGEFEAFQAASGGRVAIVTLAPEHPGSIEFIRRAVSEGVVIALGHTAADGPTLRDAVEAGATLSTHLGNGIASPLPRHPNPIWDQAACDGLTASLIADGHHVGPEILRVLVRAKTADRVILVSDASPLAGLPPGTYGDWAVDPSGKIVVAGTPYLAGSNRDLDVGLTNLMESAGVGLAEAFATVSKNPARLLDRDLPGLAPGKPANLVRFRLLDGNVRIVETWVDGRRVEPSLSPNPPDPPPG